MNNDKPRNQEKEKVITNNTKDYKYKINKKYEDKILASFIARLELIFFDKIINEGINCETELDGSDFIKFNLESKKFKNLIKDYAKSWQLTKLNDEIYANDKFIGTVREIDDLFKKLFDKYIKNKDNDLKQIYSDHFKNELFSEESFNNLLSKDICYYCGISVDQMKKLADHGFIYKKSYTRGRSMELDRKIPYLEYTPENAVPCCYWCNNAKTDEFTGEEFKYIAKNITNIWNDRIQKYNNFINNENSKLNNGICKYESLDKIEVDQIQKYRQKINDSLRLP